MYDDELLGDDWQWEESEEHRAALPSHTELEQLIDRILAD
jgi:hypothetical protein